MSTLHQIELAGIRVDQNNQMESTILIWRTTDPGTLDKNTATYSNPATVTIYNGPGYFVPIVARRDRFDVHGEQQVYQNQNRVLIPWNAGTELGEEIRIGDTLRVTESEDATLNLRDQEIKDVLMVSDLTLRRLTTIDIKE